MKYPILKSIAGGMFIGLALFAFPFTIHVIGTIVFIGILLRLIRGPRWHRHGFMHMAWANMSGFSKEEFERMTPEERSVFRRKMYMEQCSKYSKYKDIKEEKNNPE